MNRLPVVDVALAVLFATGALLEVFVGGIPGPTVAKLVLALVTTLPLAWRTVAPVPATVATAGGYVLAVALGVPSDEPLVPVVAPILATYALGAHGSIRAMALGGTFAIAAYAVAGAVGAQADLSSVVLPPAAVLGSIAVGRAVREMGFESEVLEARATQAEHEAQTAVAAERARIARELHDVIGHSISVMGVQAGAVRRRLTSEQDQEREALVAVERVGRDAVEEMQRLLGLLRADGQDAGPGTQLTHARVDELVGQMRAAGLDVDLDVDGRLDDLAAGRALSAYRILQEAFTNVLRHAPGAHVTVSLQRTEAELRIEVVDDGGARPGLGPEGGNGLVGMRERAALYGGTIDAGPRLGGGFAVTARLPLGGA